MDIDPNRFVELRMGGNIDQRESEEGLCALNICNPLQLEIFCLELANQNSTVQDLEPASFFLWDSECQIPALNERVRDLGYNVVFQLLLNSLGQTRMCFSVFLKRGLAFHDFQDVWTVFVSPSQHYTSQYSIALAYRSPLLHDVQQSRAHFRLDFSLNRTGLHRWLGFNNYCSKATRTQFNLVDYFQRSLQQVIIFFRCFILLHAVLSSILLFFCSFHRYRSQRNLLCAPLAGFMLTDCHSVACVLSLCSYCTFRSTGHYREQERIELGLICSYLNLISCSMFEIGVRNVLILVALLQLDT
ncbi:MAG: hypothetical protein EZS28_021854 [Streblomastix strix]|uniref:Uncharacterized protein n=1 Tax=Streblomastix strix TaxID=222440 RepID=A0A5J4VJ36_9EUKA|nr:MAG: hypothetical protein EZS28_021854 [Streblomastix strix]